METLNKSIRGVLKLDEEAQRFLRSYLPWLAAATLVVLAVAIIHLSQNRSGPPDVTNDAADVMTCMTKYGIKQISQTSEVPLAQSVYIMCYDILGTNAIAREHWIRNDPATTGLRAM